ncbi:MAG: hypothetical protein AAFQ92_14780 [Bacteroidota bacterium]
MAVKVNKNSAIGRHAIFSVQGTTDPSYDRTVKSPWAADAGLINNWKNSGIDIAPWGANNLKPLWLLQMLEHSNINSALIYSKVSLAMGRLYTFKWEYDPQQNKEVKQFFDPGTELRRFLRSKKITKLMRKRATDFFITGTAWNQFTLSRDRSRIADIMHVDSSTVRCEIMDPKTKMIRHFYVCSDWENAVYHPKQKTARSHTHREPNVRKYPAFREDNPQRYLQSLHQSRLYWTGKPYYGTQPWHAGHEWLEYGTQMPIWMRNNIEKAMNIKYHVEYPADFFKYTEAFETDEEREEEKERVFTQIDQNLSGVDNASSAFFTGYETNHEGKPLKDWKIKALKNEIKDEAFIKAFYAANIAAVSSQGIDPALAAIQMEGRMPISGSDKRISYQLHEVLKNDEVREIMVEPLEIWRDVNGLDPDMQFGFAVRNILTLAEDETGISNEVS